jgi:lipopolysaccharide/colanic/teichoic acid biosynthesis glycosyltransferase
VARLAKRALDVSAAALGLAAGAPLFLGVALAVRRNLGAPVLFRQMRPGLDEKPFALLKFRTMREPRPGEDRYDSDAERLTSLGRWLRATSLDELPTLWNVLCGEMSLVGPRPLLLEYLERYTPEQRRRHLVQPGITGWAVVNGRNSLGWEKKFALDVWYVDNWSFRLDLKILVMTLSQVVRREGVTHQDHATMPQFRGHASNGKRP